MGEAPKLPERIKSFIKSHKLDVQKFSRKYGFDPANVYKWQKGTRPSDAEDLLKLESVLSGKPVPKIIDDTTEDNKVSIRILSETNSKLVDGHLRLIALLEDDKAEKKKESATKRAGENTHPDIELNAETVLSMLAHIASHDKFPNVEEARKSLAAVVKGGIDRRYNDASNDSRKSEGSLSISDR